MLESVYITFIIITFTILVISFFTEKYIAKSFLAALSIILFVVLAFSSAQVEILTCTSTACTTQNLFYEENIWFFWGMSMFSAVMLIVYVFLAISVALTGKKGELEGHE